MATPTSEERLSPEVAKTTLAGLWPDATQRELGLGLFRAGIMAANDYGANKWCTSLRAKSLRLNVGRLLFLGLEKDLFISFKFDALGAKGREWLEGLSSESKAFPAIPDIHCIHIPQQEIANALEYLKEPFIAGVRQVASVTKGTPYMSAHSPGVLDYVFDGLDHPTPTSGATQLGNESSFESLFNRFLSDWWNTPKSQKHRTTIQTMRSIAKDHFASLAKLSKSDPEFTKKTLLWCLPHDKTKANAERGAWMPTAGAITKEIEAWFEGAKWVKAGDWPVVARKLFSFFLECQGSPDSLPAALTEFETSLPAKGFQSGMISPFLNALRPSEFLVVNTKSIEVINRFKDAKVTRKLIDLPVANRLGWEIINEYGIEEEAEPEEAILPCDVFDAFCHWVVAIYSKQDVPWFKIAPGEQADHWDECLEKGMICIGWKRLGDISGLSEAEFETQLAEIAEGGDEVYKTGPQSGAWQVLTFRDIPVGAIVVANRGTDRVLGIGQVTGTYFFDGTPNIPLPHRLPVKWFDTKTRVVMQPGWVQTLRRLDPETIHEIRNAPLETSGVAEDLTLFKEDDFSLQEDTLPSWWWLNFNPSIWKISDQLVGTEQVFTSTNEAGNKRRIFACFQAVQPGDRVIAYETSPTKRVVSLLEITKGLYSTGEGPDQFAFRILKHLPDGMTFPLLMNEPGLQDCSPLKNNQGSLFPLKPEEASLILRDPNIRSVIPISATQVPQKPEEVFFAGDAFIQETVARWSSRLNLIIQGPPGVGKTFVARKLIHELMGCKDATRERWIQFHQSYGYEEFVQGIRPQAVKSGASSNVQFRRMDGAFVQFCIGAQRRPGLPFVFVIDEINRGNLSKVFGELMVLIEPDKRDADHSLRLAYQMDGEDFFVPPNVYILGLMNTADRSLAVVDYALRRRFMFRSLKPAFDSKLFEAHLHSVCTTPQLATHILQSFRLLNDVIEKDEVSLGSGYCIGHSYFTAFGKRNPLSPYAFGEVLQDEIGPLLREYWFDQPSLYETRMKGLRFDANP